MSITNKERAAILDKALDALVAGNYDVLEMECPFPGETTWEVVKHMPLTATVNATSRRKFKAWLGFGKEKIAVDRRTFKASVDLTGTVGLKLVDGPETTYP